MIVKSMTISSYFMPGGINELSQYKPLSPDVLCMVKNSIYSNNTSQLVLSIIQNKTKQQKYHWITFKQQNLNSKNAPGVSNVYSKCTKQEIPKAFSFKNIYSLNWSLVLVS